MLISKRFIAFFLLYIKCKYGNRNKKSYLLIPGHRFVWEEVFPHEVLDLGQHVRCDHLERDPLLLKLVVRVWCEGHVVAV